MKNIILILFSLATFVRGETVYLNNVRVSNGEPDVVLYDERGIESVSVQPFLNIFNGQGDSIPLDDTVAFYITQSYYFVHHHIWFPTTDPAIVTVPLEAFDYDQAIPIVLGCGAVDEMSGVELNGGFFDAHPEAVSISYGYDILSYQAVPEPPMMLLLACGGLAIAYVCHRKSIA